MKKFLHRGNPIYRVTHQVDNWIRVDFDLNVHSGIAKI